jgi:hypothetical protein
MSRAHIDHRDIVRFAEEKVNLPKDKADEYRAQAKRLREKLETYLDEHPDFTLKKMLLSGSLAKGTALRSLNDIDVACYISGAMRRTKCAACWTTSRSGCARRSRTSRPDQVKPQTYSVTVSFQGTGLDVDVVPILYDGDPEWYGQPRQPRRRLVPQDQHPAAPGVHRRKRKRAQPDALRAGRAAGEVLGPAHEAASAMASASSPS